MIYITPKELASEYGVKESNIYVAWNKKTTLSKFMKQEGKALYINIKALQRRKNFSKRVWLRSHENYYTIVEHISEYKLALILSRYSSRSQNTWATFLSHTLFNMGELDKPIIVFEIPKMRWDFFRLTTFIIRKLSRLQELKEEDIYSRLPNRDNYNTIYKQRGCTR